MFVALTQVDFMLIRIAADLVVKSHTTYYFLRGKEVDPVRYDTWKTSCGTRACKGSESLHKILLSGDEGDSSTHGLTKLAVANSKDLPSRLRTHQRTICKCDKNKNSQTCYLLG